MVVIDRWECMFLRSASPRWLLVYGRRKTGKTWLLRRCTGWSFYATVLVDGGCIVDSGGGASITGLEECINTVVRLLRKPGSTVVVDEFQRLPRKYWELIASVAWEAEGGLYLCGSSMSIVRRVFSSRSPLLGLLTPFHVGLAAVEDTVVSLRSAGLSDAEAVLWAPLARDPWLLRHLEPAGSPWEAVASMAPRLFAAARGLIGEVFEEEERQLTRLYEAVLKLLAEGFWRAGDIAARLYEAGLSSSPSAGYATGVLSVLEEMGLVEKIPLWRTRRARRYYRHRSSLVGILYSFASLVDELGSSPTPEQVRARYGVEFAFNIGEMLAEHYRLVRGYSIQATRDIDVVLLDSRGRAQWGFEVKLGRVAAREAASIAEWLRSTGVRKTGLVAVKGAERVEGFDAYYDAARLVELAARLAEARRREAVREAGKLEA